MTSAPASRTTDGLGFRSHPAIRFSQIGAENGRCAMSSNPIDPKAGATANLVYILYLVSLVVGVTALIGVVMAYINKRETPEWVQTHYRFQIRTFWIGLLFSIIGALTTLIQIGWLIVLLVAVWWIIRCVKGMQYIGKQHPYPNPETWMF
jgi:uncharacterized membrane protein